MTGPTRSMPLIFEAAHRYLVKEHTVAPDAAVVDLREFVSHAGPWSADVDVHVEIVYSQGARRRPCYATWPGTLMRLLEEYDR